MAVTNERSAFIRDFKKKEKELAEVAKESVGGGFMTDEEIVETLGLSDVKKQFVTKVSRVRYGTDKNKNPYFAFNFTIAQGEHEGITVSQFVGLGGKTKADRQKGMKRLCGLLQRLDYDTTQWAVSESAVNAVDAADELTQNKPGVRLSLGVWGDNKDRLNIDVVGMTGETASSNGAPSKPAPKAKTETKVSMETLGAKADDGDEEAEETLTTAATSANVDPDDFDTWMDLGVHLDKEGSSSDSEDSDESSEAEDYSEWVNYEATFNSEETGELTVTTTSYDADTELFTVTDEDGNDYECEFSDLTFAEE